ncbi:hypothetical protein K503DRAFT_710765 [Rhizopogon vinicolor AM-OR11-026]|uniref:Uncharacterized protein n=1 Tax=Rhizopogon vinicolor AM-OR11-026 TaxID=1314800 RepID=A0A1B7NBY9_9AGAM|nr:hypothetical protein K503DRAFT_710765 [Rhizopogon vinicolor AM-OR11-026]
MYPIPQPDEFDSQVLFNLQYPQDFTDIRSHYPPSANYIHTSRPPSIDVYDTAEDTSIPLNYSYPPIQYDYAETQTQEHLHAPAPVPIPYRSPHLTNSSRHHSSPYVGHGYEGTNNHHAPYPHLADGSTTDINHDYYTNAPQYLFPTPSELLTDLSADSAPISTALHSPLAHPTQRAHSQSSERGIEAPAPARPAASKAESQRKARQRAIAEEIGFTPTDPDTISSHEKKRHYLECLEHYVLYLHDQLHLVNTAPLPFERVSTYRGLSSRSIRTLLVHMQNINRRLHENTLAEEQVFLNLSAEVMDAHGAGFPTRRHSADAVDQTTSSHTSPFANCSVTGARDGERALRFGMASSSIGQPQGGSINRSQGHFDVYR